LKTKTLEFSVYLHKICYHMLHPSKLSSNQSDSMAPDQLTGGGFHSETKKLFCFSWNGW